MWQYEQDEEVVQVAVPTERDPRIWPHKRLFEPAPLITDPDQAENHRRKFYKREALQAAKGGVESER
jgi:hypothetical protein